MSVLGDLFYQLWSYGEAPPTDTPTSCDDSWLQEAWLQEQVSLCSSHRVEVVAMATSVSAGIASDRRGMACDYVPCEL